METGTIPADETHGGRDVARPTPLCDDSACRCLPTRARRRRSSGLHDHASPGGFMAPPPTDKTWPLYAALTVIGTGTCAAGDRLTAAPVPVPMTVRAA